LARINLAAALEAVGDLAAAIAEAQDLLPVLEADPSTNPDWIAALRATLARSLALSGAHARAVALMRTAVDATCRLPGPACTVERFRYAGVLRRARRLDASEAELHAIAEPLAELGRGNPVLAAHVERLAALLDLDRGRRARAISPIAICRCWWSSISSPCCTGPALGPRRRSCCARTSPRCAGAGCRNRPGCGRRTPGSGACRCRRRKRGLYRNRRD
jgi:hypothetical protein